VCEAPPANSPYPGYGFQIVGGEEWYAESSPATGATITATATMALAAPSTTYGLGFTVVVISGAVLPAPFDTTSLPCVSSGLSQVLTCSINTNGGLVIGNEEALNGICAGPNSALVASNSEAIQDLGVESMTTPYVQTNLGVAFNQGCGADTNIMNGNDIWIMTADVVV
jgi:hypothetical protein